LFVRPILCFAPAAALRGLLRGLSGLALHFRNGPGGSRVAKNISCFFPDSLPAKAQLACGRRHGCRGDGAGCCFDLRFWLEGARGLPDRGLTARVARRFARTLYVAMELLHRPLPSFLSGRARAKSHPL